MNKVIILVTLLVILSLGYLAFKNISKKPTIAPDVLFRVDHESMKIAEFEEFLRLGNEKGEPDPERAQRYYNMFWENKAIRAWNKRHEIEELPEYKKEFKKMEEYYKKHPQEVATNAKEKLANQLMCMILIECWWRDIDNNFFVHNFPLFKPYLERKELSFDKFGSLSGQMILDLAKELTTVENTDYLKRNNLKGIDSLLADIRHPERRPKKYEFGATNSITTHRMNIILYGKNDEVISEQIIAAAKRVSEKATEPANATFSIPFKSEEQKKGGIKKVLVKALGEKDAALEEQIIPVKPEYFQGNFHVMIGDREHGPKKEGSIFYAYII